MGRVIIKSRLIETFPSPLRGEGLILRQTGFVCPESRVRVPLTGFFRVMRKWLAPTPNPEAPKKLTAILLRGAIDYGYNTDLWTTRRISDVIHREFHVRYDRSHVGRLLVAQGWSCQKPERRALERDEDAIKRWKQYRWSAIKKKPKS